MISPQIDAPQVTVAEDQHEFRAITAAVVEHPQGMSHLLAFRPNDEERARIFGGEDIYISLLTFGGPMQGILVMTGKHEASQIFNVQETV
jgi:hypothetical protein